MNELNFCKFTMKPNIKKVIWEITNECNYSCSYCIFSSTGKKPRGELSLNQIHDTLIQLKSQGFNYIKFTGGEPFLRDDFLNILQMASSLNFSIDVSTNASLITEEISYQLSLIHLNFIHVSLDGYDIHSHESVRGKNTFNKTIIGLHNLLKFNKNIRVGTVIHKNNENHLQKIVDLVDIIQVKTIIFSLMKPIGRMHNDTSFIAQQSTENIITNIKNLTSNFCNIEHNINSDIAIVSFQNKSSKVCPGGQDFLFIDSIGIVSPCTWISEEKPKFHYLSLHHYSLTVILNSHLFQEFNLMKNNARGSCPTSYHNQSLFQNIYSFSTENLSFLSLINHSNKKSALTITGSGDQALMLIKNGYSKITCIDSNYLSHYFSELKIKCFTYLDYDEFILFFKNNPNSFNYHVFKKIKSHLSPACEKFWNQIYIKHNYNGHEIRNSNLFNLKYDDWNIKFNNVPYLSNIDIYNHIQSILKSNIIEFNFITESFEKFVTNEKFDLILLSNIADYTHKFYKEDYILQFKNNFVLSAYNLLNKNGMLMFAYIYDFENQSKSFIRNKINLPSIRSMYFKDLNYKEIIFKSAIQNLNNDVLCYIIKDN